MLFRKTLPSGTLDLLTSIMAVPKLGSFYLAGGSALALQIGHRTSLDLDLFCNCSMDNREIIECIFSLRPFQMLSQSKSILVINIQNVKVDFVRYFYKEIRSIRKINGLRLASIEDIAAMKLAAITGRGRKRDFIDLFFLLKKYSLKKMLEFYKKKYPDGNELMVMRSLLYFEDAENDTMPNLLREDEIQWADIKNFINQEVRRMAIKL